MINYNIMEVQNGFLIETGDPIHAPGMMRVASMYVAKDMTEVGKILRDLYKAEVKRRGDFPQ